MDCNLLGSSVYGILQARIRSGLTIPLPGNLPDIGIEPMSLVSPALAGKFFTTAPPGKPLMICVGIKPPQCTKGPHHSYQSFVAVVQLLGCVQLFATPWTTALQAPVPFTISQSLVKLMSIESVIPSNHLILCCPLLLLPSIFLILNVFSNESALHIR